MRSPPLSLPPSTISIADLSGCGQCGGRKGGRNEGGEGRKRGRGSHVWSSVEKEKRERRNENEGRSESAVNATRTKTTTTTTLGITRETIVSASAPARAATPGRSLFSFSSGSPAMSSFRGSSQSVSSPFKKLSKYGHMLSTFGAFQCRNLVCGQR